MGIINKGILGGFSGTVGNVIGGSWKGITYMRSQPARRSTAQTQPQLEQQLKFKLVVAFFQPITALLRISFKGYTAKMTGFNSAVSYALKNAVSGSYPAYDINYPMALIARGDLPNAGSPVAAAAAGGNVTFTWTNNAGVGKAKDGDKAMLVVFCPMLNAAVFTTGSAARSAGTETLDVSGFTGEAVETYLSFIAEDGKEVATSIYTGHLTII